MISLFLVESLLLHALLVRSNSTDEWIQGCQDIVSAVDPSFDFLCDQHCEYNAGMGAAWCAANSAEELADCVVKNDPEICTKNATTASPTPSPSSLDSIIVACQNAVSSKLPEWEEDCKDKCEFYATGSGTAWCGVPHSAEELIACVIEHDGDHCVATEVAKASLKMVRRAFAKSAAPRSKASNEWIQGCQDIVSAVDPSFEVLCDQHCEYNAGMGAVWCGAKSAEELADCVVKNDPEICTKNATTASPSPSSLDNIIAECQSALSSTLPEWEEDCKAKCEFYAKGSGTAWCGVPHTAEELISCVIEHDGDHCIQV